MSERKPVGSGIFAVASGVIFLGTGASVLSGRFAPADVDPTTVFGGWLVATGLVAGVWGVNRYLTGKPDDDRIGMDTINMVVTMIGVSFAIAALILKT